MTSGARFSHASPMAVWYGESYRSLSSGHDHFPRCHATPFFTSYYPMTYMVPQCVTLTTRLARRASRNPRSFLNCRHTLCVEYATMPVYGLTVMRLREEDNGDGNLLAAVLDVDPIMTTFSMRSVSCGEYRIAERRKRIRNIVYHVH